MWVTCFLLRCTASTRLRACSYRCCTRGIIRATKSRPATPVPNQRGATHSLSSMSRPANLCLANRAESSLFPARPPPVPPPPPPAEAAPPAPELPLGAAAISWSLVWPPTNGQPAAFPQSARSLCTCLAPLSARPVAAGASWCPPGPARVCSHQLLVQTHARYETYVCAPHMIYIL